MMMYHSTQYQQQYIVANSCQGDRIYIQVFIQTFERRLLPDGYIIPRLRAGRPMDRSYPQVYYISDIKVSLSLVSSHRKINSSNTDPGYDLLAILEDLDHVLEICVMLLIILNGVPIPSCDPDLYVLPMIKIVSIHNTAMCSRTRTSGGLHHTNNICAW